MKVEQSFVIDGQAVVKQHDGKEISVFSTNNLDMLFIVSNDSGQVIARIDVDCEMSQGVGFVDSLKFSDY